uniref:SH3 domain-containing GRB2-like protein n=1 Tax=Panagrellus redivivus TaxID=6233 RepID=A0A7E4UZG9_PANRE
MALIPPAFLARLAVSNHECNLEQSEIFIVTPVDESSKAFTGSSLAGEALSGQFSDSDFERLNLPDGKYAVSTDEYESLQNDHLSFMKFTLLAIVERVDDEFYRGYVTMDSGKRLGKAGLFPAGIVTMLPTSEHSSTNSLAILLDDFKAKSDGEVTLSKGECVHILQVKDDWCQIKTATGVVSSCPKSFLREVDNSQYQVPETTAMPDPYGTALYDFSSEHENELSFIAGDILHLFRWVDAEWLEGENKRTQLSGFIPASFVQVVVSPPGLEPQTTGDSTQSSVKTDECQTIGIATVLYPFEARYNDELTIEAGTSLKVVAIQGDWLKCWNPDTDEVGIVPRDFLRVFSNDDDDVSGSDSKATNSMISNFSEVDVTANDEGVPEDKPWTTFGCEILPPSSDHYTYGKPLPEVPPAETPLEKKPPPARPPPPKINRLPLIKRSDSAAQPLQVTQFPVQRMAPNRPKSIAKISTHSSEDSDRDEGWESRRAKILEEIITSENIYLFDLSAWETAVEQNPNLPENKKKIILNGYNMLKYLSRGISTSLVAEQAKPVIDQEIGLRFMQMKEVFYKTYGRYFRSAEQVAEILMKGDEQTQKALQESIEQMRKQGSNVFDMSTALSRPIQRCLRYPLYLGEIVKSTPITHPDHPKLMEALRQMGQLATKMNESKRRKELAKKYSKNSVEQRESGFLNRLSKLNLKSLAKKSTRFQYRLTSKIGLNATYRDDDFDTMIRILNDVQQRFCHLIYQLTVYKNRIVRLAKKYVDANTIPKIYNSPSTFEHNNLIKRLNAYVSDLEHEVVDLTSSAHDLAKRDFTHIIHKRYDKLADWEMAVRSKKSSDVIDMRRCEFEALNDQLKLVIPKETDKLVEGLNSYVRQIKQLDESFFLRVKNWLQEFTFTAPPDFLTFVDPKAQRLIQIEKTLRPRVAKEVILISQNTSTPITQPSLKEVVAARGRQLPPIDPEVLTILDSQVYGRPQFKEEREKLIKLCKILGLHDSLCKVCMDYISDDKQFVLVKGDIIRRRRENDGLGLVENGLSTWTVPSKVYRKMSNPFSTTVGAVSSDSNADWVNVDKIQEFVEGSGKKSSAQDDKKQKEVRYRKQKSKKTDATVTLRPDNLPLESAERASVNWLQYDDKFVDLSSPTTEVQRPAPAPPEARQTWTTFDNDNDTPRVIVRPESIFGNMSNPIPMEPIKANFGKNGQIEAAEEPAMVETPRSAGHHRVAPPPPSQSIPNISPANPFYNELYNIPPPAIPKRASTTPKSTVDALDMLVNQEIERTRQASSRPLPPAPLGPPPPPPPRHGITSGPPATLPIGPVSHSQNGFTRQVNDRQSHTNGESASTNYVVSLFDFTPEENDTVQLNVNPGDRLKVLQYCDDANNDEWWLVQNQHGKTGYVPKSYLQPSIQ